MLSISIPVLVTLKNKYTGGNSIATATSNAGIQIIGGPNPLPTK